MERRGICPQPGARSAESGQVTLLGQQPFSRLASLRRQAMITVVCSRYENAPRALIEAMSLGCPTVAAKVGGIPEILQDQVDGLHHRNDDDDDLATQVTTLLNNPGAPPNLAGMRQRHASGAFTPRPLRLAWLNSTVGRSADGTLYNDIGAINDESQSTGSRFYRWIPSFRHHSPCRYAE